MQALKIACAASMAAAMTIAPAGAELKGDKAAIERVSLMLDRLGGAEVWAETRSLYLEYEGWRADTSQPVVERAWRDLRTPNQKVVFEGRTSEVIFNMTADASWLEISDRAPRIFNAEEHAVNLDFWNYDFYTVIYNLARGDERIRLDFEAPQTVRLKGPGGADWGWFQIDDTGQPVRWGAPNDGDQLEYIYGPVKSYGNINFPAWGTAADGFWRFDYTTVDVSRRPIGIELSAPDADNS